jgi:hypothetical protein
MIFISASLVSLTALLPAAEFLMHFIRLPLATAAMVQSLTVA